jgi:hypothetical protein
MRGTLPPPVASVSNALRCSFLDNLIPRLREVADLRVATRQQRVALQLSGV